MFVDKLPIPKDGLEKLKQISEHPSANDEIEVSRIIYQLYGLTSQEIEYIEGRDF